MSSNEHKTMTPWLLRIENDHNCHIVQAVYNAYTIYIISSMEDLKKIIVDAISTYDFNLFRTANQGYEHNTGPFTLWGFGY